MAEKKGISKVFWIILFAVITILLCYLFTVVSFYFIWPYNISAKLGLWPFGSQQSIGRMYMDSVVQINYKAIDDHFENVDINVCGVNVRKNGCIIAPLSEFSNCSEDAQIKVFTNGGRAYGGVVVAKDKNRNLAIIKCKNMDGSDKAINIPYVGIGSLSDCKTGTKVIMTSVNPKTRSFTSSISGGFISENSLIYNAPKEVDGELGYDYTVSSGFLVETVGSASFSGGAVFNKKGKLLGLSFGVLPTASENPSECFVQPVYGALDYIKKVASLENGVYKNDLVDAFCGFDAFEAEDMITIWGEDSGKTTFYFDNTWNNITDDILKFTSSGEKGFHLFKEFSYNGNTISAHSAITKVKVGDKIQNVKYRCDLIDTLFKAKKGDRVVLTYIELDDPTVKTLSFSV